VEAMTAKLVIQRKYERDIDLMLGEEFVTAPDFATWFLKNSSLHKDRDAEVVEVFVSKTDHTGESDLVVVYKDKIDASLFAFHLEDKIDAPLMSNQEDRYRARGEKAVSRGDYQTFETFLCAPNAYIRGEPRHAGFDATVSYESIAEFLDASVSDPRRSHRAEFIRTAASRPANKWTRTDDEVTNHFWARAYEVASKEFPLLEMKRPRHSMGNSYLYLRPRVLKGFAITAYLELKGPRGWVDLTFNNASIEHFHEALGGGLSGDISIHQTANSVALRIETGSPFEVAMDEGAAIEAFRRSLVAAESLVEFAHEQKALISQAIARS
jgi:hypothetical protein